MDIISRVKALNLPIGKYCVFGSGLQEIHGLKKAKDVDLLVTEDLYNELKNQGWKRKWFFWRTLWCKRIVSGENEAFTNLFWGLTYRPDTHALIVRAEIHDGIPFLRLEDLLEFTKRLPRKKDKRHAEIIENYLKNKN